MRRYESSIGSGSAVQATLHAMRTSALCSLMAIPALVCAPTPAQASGDFKQNRNQGMEYFKRRMYPAAIKSLRSAANSRGGDKDFKTHYYLAKSFYAQVDIEKAFPAARRSLKIATKDKSKRSAKALLTRMEEFFSGVEIKQADDQKGQVHRGYIHLEDKGGLINKKKKEAFRKIRGRFRANKVSLPTTIYLPFGTYTANLAPFEIMKGETAEAETYLYVPDDEAESTSAWWYIGGGAVVAAGAAVAAVLLSAEAPTPQRKILEPTVDLGLQ